LSGVMMLILGALLVVSPQLLSNILVAAAIVFVAIGVTWTIVKATTMK
jgi:hypothetical protein